MTRLPESNALHVSSRAQLHTVIQRWWRYGVAALGLTTLACSGEPTRQDLGVGSAPGAECELVYREGHGDLYFATHPTDGFHAYVRAALGGSTREELHALEQLCVVVPPASRERVNEFGGAPRGDAYAFLGIEAGKTFWLLPAASQAGLPWFGLSTEQVPSTSYLELWMARVQGPPESQLSSWSTDALGNPSPIFSTALGLDSAQFAAGRHLHFNWAFSDEGLYRVEFQAYSRRVADDTIEESAKGLLRFWVQP
ncbi:MAG TPA: choice-of-anchor M domain-containing protein [Polyangiaceae bacterium]|nr:choice-of-anchor M domain-containing protein [Polyangiaceae bacterium]